MMLRERYKQKTCKADSIEALCRGGQVCSSVEMVVMIMERRDLATWLQLSSQLVFFLGGTTIECGKTI